jgi:hypothetical protein
MERIPVAYRMFLRDKHFRAKFWPTAVFMSEGVCVSRIRAVEGPGDNVRRFDAHGCEVVA